jgi:ATP-dependent protease ClpP protease subunit
MAKDIILYGTITQYQMAYFISQVADIQKEDPSSKFKVRINCEGGSPDFGMSFITKVQELEEAGLIESILVEGMAHSMALFSLCYVKNATAIDTAQGVLHRSSYPDWIESHASYKDSIFAKSNAKTNKDLERAFRAAVDVDALENLPQMKEANLKLKDIFSLDDQKEILLTAADMKKIGLIKSIVTVTPKKQAEIKSMLMAFQGADTPELFLKAAKAVNVDTDEPKTNNTMEKITLDELKTKFPTVYKEAYNEGVAAEKDRVEGIMVFGEIDPTACKEAIASGKPLNAKQMAELSLKSVSAEMLKKVKGDSAEEVTTTEEGKNKSEKEVKTAAFEKDLKKTLGIKEPAAA